MYKRLWKCNRTIQSMLEARGYLPSNDLIEIGDSGCEVNHTNMIKTYETFEETIHNITKSEGSGKLTQSALNKITYLWQHSFSGEWIYVFFVIDKIGVNLITGYVESMNESGVSRSILVSVPNENKSTLGDQSVLTPFAIKEINKYKLQEDKIIEHFYFDDLMINILEHEFQPIKSEILIDEEKTKRTKIYGINPKDGCPLVQRISLTDPLTRFLGLQKGDIVKFTCYSETVGEVDKYRVCWEA
jgi:DNA-directed RNA polymerase I, II, and III subunit RPABC1